MLKTVLLVLGSILFGVVVGYWLRHRFRHLHHRSASPGSSGGAQWTSSPVPAPAPFPEDVRASLRQVESTTRRVDEKLERLQEDVNLLSRIAGEIQTAQRQAPASRPAPAPSPSPTTSVPAMDRPPAPERVAFESVNPAPRVSGPPPGAVHVEVRDDAVVESSSFPPEAWLVTGGAGGTARMTLNPGVPLSEPALRRLRTFFEWDAERPNAAYDTYHAAVVYWDEAQRSGRVAQRGKARPFTG